MCTLKILRFASAYLRLVRHVTIQTQFWVATVDTINDQAKYPPPSLSFSLHICILCLLLSHFYSFFIFLSPFLQSVKYLFSLFLFFPSSFSPLPFSLSILFPSYPLFLSSLQKSFITSAACLDWLPSKNAYKKRRLKHLISHQTLAWSLSLGRYRSTDTAPPPSPNPTLRKMYSKSLRDASSGKTAISKKGFLPDNPIINRSRNCAK